MPVCWIAGRDAGVFSVLKYSHHLPTASPTDSPTASPTEIMNALCIVGEWRTFAMPAVHTSVVQASKVWHADAFLFYHTRYNAKAMSHPHRDNASGCAFDSSLLRHFTEAIELSPPCPNEDMKASTQFLQISKCFHHATRAAQKKKKSYEWFIRSRPDYLIYDPKPLPFYTRRILMGYPKPDMLFAIPKTRLGVWFGGMPSICIAACCMEYVHRMFTTETHVVWQQDGAVVRGINRPAFETKNARVVRGMTCDITSYPKHLFGRRS